MDDCVKSGASGSSSRPRSLRASSTTRLKIRIGSTEIMDADVPFNPESREVQTEESSESSGGTLSPDEPEREMMCVVNQPWLNKSVTPSNRQWTFIPRGTKEEYYLRSESLDSEASGESNLVSQSGSLQNIGFDTDGNICAFCAFAANVIFGEGVLIRCRPTAGHTFRRTPTRKKIFTVEEWCNCALDVTVRMREGKLLDSDGKPFPANIANPFTDAEGRPFGLVDELARIGYLDEPDPSRIVDAEGYVWAHYNCALWSEGVVHQSENTEDPLLNVDRALGVGLSQRCHYCKRFGASLTCRTGRCTKRYHFPCACAAGCFLDPESLRMWCPEHLAQVDTSSSGALCMICENSGDLSDMVFCTACNQHSHTTCVAGDTIGERITISPTVRVGWLCPDCKVCIVCRETKDENKMLMCDVCDKGCHTYCLRPPVTSMPKHGFKCERCRVCRDCGIRAINVTCKWHLSYTVCDKCYIQRKKGNFCVICERSCREKLPPGGVRRCAQCRKLIHSQCDPLLEEENATDFNDPAFICLACRRVQQQQQDADVFIIDADSSNSGVSGVTSNAGGASSTSTSQPPPAKLRRVSGDSLTSSAATTPAAGRTPALDYAAAYDDDSWSSTTDFDSNLNQVSAINNSSQLSQPSAQLYHGANAGKALGHKGAKRVPPSSKAIGKGNRVTVGKNVKRTCRGTGTARQSKQKASQKILQFTFDLKLFERILRGRVRTKTKNKVRKDLGKCREEKEIPEIEEAESKNDDKDDHPTTVVLFSANDRWIQSQDICLACGSIGKDSPLIPCTQCGQCYHTFCAGVEKLSLTMATKGWRCLDCTICEGCGKTTDEERLILCDDCDISYHTYCLDPPLDAVPKGAWRCKNCVICTMCGSKESGKNSQWQKNWTMCGPCYSRQACHVCAIAYEIDDTIILCDTCSRWSHSRCDGLVSEDDIENACENGYNCPTCREKAGLGSKPLGNDHVLGLHGSNTSANINGRVFDTNSITDGTGDGDDAESCAIDQSRGYFMDGVVITENGLKTVREALLKIPKKVPVRRPTGQMGKSTTAGGQANGAGGQLARLLSTGPASSVGSATPHREDDLQSELANGNSGLDINEFLTGETNNPTGGNNANVTTGMMSLKSEDSDEGSTDCFLNPVSTTSGVDSSLASVNSSPLMATSMGVGPPSQSSEPSIAASLETTVGAPGSGGGPSVTGNKAKPRNRRVMNLGVGGFRARPSRAMPKKATDGEEAANTGGVGGTGAASSNKKRRRPKRRLDIEESYPDYLMDAFLGRDLMEKEENGEQVAGGSIAARCQTANSVDSLESEEDTLMQSQGTTGSARLLDEADEEENDNSSTNDLMMFFSPQSREASLVGSTTISGGNSSVSGTLHDPGFKVETHSRGSGGHPGELDDLQEYIINDFLNEIPGSSGDASAVRGPVEAVGLGSGSSSSENVLADGDTPTGSTRPVTDHNSSVGSSTTNPSGVQTGSSTGGTDLGDLWASDLLNDSDSLQVDEKVLEDMISSLRNEDCAGGGGPSPSTDGNFELPPTSSLIATTQAIAGSQGVVSASGQRVNMLTAHPQVANPAIMAQNTPHLQPSQQAPGHLQSMAHPQMSPGSAASFMHHQPGPHPHPPPQPATIFAQTAGQVPVSLASPVLRRAPAVTSGYPPPPPPPYPGQPPPSPQLTQPGTPHYPQGQHTPHVSPVGPGGWPNPGHDQAVAVVATGAQSHPDDPMISMMLPQPMTVPMPPPLSQTTTVPSTPPNPPISNNKRINFAKWAEDEKMGDKASTAAVLYSNTHHPDLKSKYPEFNNRAKQINKLWRKLSPEDRVHWVNMARENRTSQKANSGTSTSKKLDVDEDDEIIDYLQRMWLDSPEEGLIMHEDIPTPSIKKDSNAAQVAAAAAAAAATNQVMVGQPTPMPPPPVPMDVVPRQRPMFTTQTSVPGPTDIIEATQATSVSQKSPEDSYVHSPAKMSPGGVFHRQLSHPGNLLSCGTPTPVTVSEGSAITSSTVGNSGYPIAARGSPMHTTLASPQHAPANSPLQRPTSCDYQQPLTPQTQVTVTSPYRGVGPSTPTSSGPSTPQYYLVNQSTPTQQPPHSPYAGGRGSSGGRITPTMYPTTTTPVGENMDVESATSNAAVTSPSGGPPVTPEGNRQRLKEVLAKQSNERMQKRAATGTVAVLPSSGSGSSPPADPSTTLITTSSNTIVSSGPVIQQPSPQAQLSPLSNRRTPQSVAQIQQPQPQQQQSVWTSQQIQQIQQPQVSTQPVSGSIPEAYKVVNTSASPTGTSTARVQLTSTWPQRMPGMSPQSPVQQQQPQAQQQPFRMRGPQPVLHNMVQRVSRPPPQVSQSFVHPHASHSPYVTTGQQQVQVPAQQQTMYHMTNPHMRQIPPNSAVYSQHQHAQTILQPGLTSVMQPQQVIQQHSQQQMSQPTIQVVQQVAQVSTPLGQTQQHVQHIPQSQQQVITSQSLQQSQQQQQQLIQQAQQQSPQPQSQQLQMQQQIQQMQHQIQQQQQQQQMQAQEIQVKQAQQRQGTPIQSLQAQQPIHSPVQMQQSSPLQRQQSSPIQRQMSSPLHKQHMQQLHQQQLQQHHQQQQQNQQLLLQSQQQTQSDQQQQDHQSQSPSVSPQQKHSEDNGSQQAQKSTTSHTSQQNSPSLSLDATPTQSPLSQSQTTAQNQAVRSSFNVDLDASIEEDVEEDMDEVRTTTISAAALTGQVQEVLMSASTAETRSHESPQSQSSIVSQTKEMTQQQSTPPTDPGHVQQQQQLSPSQKHPPQTYQPQSQQSSKSMSQVVSLQQQQQQQYQRQMQIQQQKQQLSNRTNQRGDSPAVYSSPPASMTEQSPVVLSKASPSSFSLLDDKQGDSQAIDFDPPVIVSKIVGPLNAKVSVPDKDTRVCGIESRGDSFDGGIVSDYRRETPPVRMATSTPDNASKDSGDSRGLEEMRGIEKEMDSSNIDRAEPSHLDQVIDQVVEDSRGWENKNPAEKDQMTELRSRERGNSRRTSSTSVSTVSTAVSSAPGVSSAVKSPLMPPHPSLSVAGHHMSGATLMSPTSMVTGVTMSTPRHPVPHSNLSQPHVTASPLPQQPPPHIMQQMHHQSTHVAPHQSIMIVPQATHTAHHNIQRHPPPHAIQMTQHPHGVHTAYADTTVSQGGQAGVQQVTASMGSYSMYSSTHLPPQQSAYHNIPPMMQMHGSLAQTTAATQHMTSQQTVTHPSITMPTQQLEAVSVSQPMPIVSAAYLQSTTSVHRDDILLKDLVEQEKLEQRQRLVAEQQQQQQQFKMPVGGATPHHPSMVSHSPVTGEQITVTAYSDWGAQQSVPSGASASQEVWMPSQAQEDDLSSTGQ